MIDRLKTATAAERLAWVTIALCVVAIALAFWSTVVAVILLVQGGGA